MRCGSVESPMTSTCPILPSPACSRAETDTRTRIADAYNRMLVSAASAWEIAIKRQLGKLDFESSPTAAGHRRRDSARLWWRAGDVGGVTPFCVQAHRLRAC